MAQPDDMFDDEDYPAYTMGRAAEIIGCSQDFLRRLGEAKLIDPYRSGGGHRRYSRYQLRLAARAREMCDQGTDSGGRLPDHHPRRPTRGSPAAQPNPAAPLTTPDPAVSQRSRRRADEGQLHRGQAPQLRSSGGRGGWGFPGRPSFRF